jgi:hypothetical protein
VPRQVTLRDMEKDAYPTEHDAIVSTLLIEPNQVHEGINKGSVSIKALVTFITEKGKPLTTAVL